MSDASQPLTIQTSRATAYLRWWSQVSALLLVIVELCWILPWFEMVTQITRTAPLWVSGLVLGAIMLASYLLGRASEALRLLKNVQLGLMGLLFLASLFVSENLLLQMPIRGVANGLVTLDPGAVLVLFFVIWMWWRGLSLSRNDIRPIVAWRRFELGLLFFMAYLFIAVRVNFILPGFGIMILFLFAGLLSVVFARVSYVGIAKGVQKNPFDLRWLLSVGGILSATILLAGVAGGLLSGQYRLLLDFLTEALKFTIALTIFILGIPGLLISIVLGPLLPWLRSLFQPFQNNSPQENPLQNLYPFYPDQGQVVNLPAILQTMIFWGLVLIVVIALMLRARRAFGGRRLNEPDEPESLLKQGEARDLLRKALQNALEGAVARLRPARQVLIAARIRRIYAQLLDLCEELNQPRRPQQTPLEFLPEMGELFSSQIEDLETITQAYVRIRYGELPESQREVAAIEQSWQKIQAEGRRLKKAGVGKLKMADVDEIERSGV
jgi:hypothetical protein